MDRSGSQPPGLTRRQRDIIRFFEDFIKGNSYAPTLREIGAAVGLFPKGAAQAALEDGSLSGSLLENLSEVSNVMAQAFNVPGAPHVRLADNSVDVVEDAPEDALTLLDARDERLDFEVSVEDYGGGRLAISMIP